jgi:lipid-A-disaccharide synthase
VPIDYPGFNLRIARHARERGIPVVYYIGPQVWAWGAGRVPRIAAAVDRMLVVFPFEEEIYRRAGMRVDFVGHPLLDTMGSRPSREETRRRLGVPEDALVLGLLPGSRLQEIRRILPVMTAAAARVTAMVPGVVVIASRADSVPAPEFQRALGRDGPIIVDDGPAAGTGSAADMALVTSGTATLETALCGTPLAVLYRTSPLTGFVGRRLVKIRRISLVNIVAEQPLVEEFLQDEARPEAVAAHAAALLRDPDRRAQLSEGLRALRDRLGAPGAARRAAAIVLEEAAS